MTAPQDVISVVPANMMSWADLQTVFGSRGAASRCRCQRYKLAPRESFGSFPRKERAERPRQQAGSGHPESGTTSGLVVYLDGEPVDWCAVEPTPVRDQPISQIVATGISFDLREQIVDILLSISGEHTGGAELDTPHFGRRQRFSPA